MNITEYIEKISELSVLLPQVGSRIVVTGWENLEVTVTAIKWIKSENRHKLFLDWKEFGKSYVWDHDEGKTWRRFLDVN